MISGTKGFRALNVYSEIRKKINNFIIKYITDVV